MGMSTHVVGIVPPDDKWRKMKAIWDSCTEAGIEVPDEVNEFFDWERPDAKGVIIDLPDANKWQSPGSSGFEVNIPELLKRNPDVKIIRFYNSW